jgi:hypothetical protein
LIGSCCAFLFNIRKIFDYKIMLWNTVHIFISEQYVFFIINMKD